MRHGLLFDTDLDALRIVPEIVHGRRCIRVSTPLKRARAWIGNVGGLALCVDSSNDFAPELEAKIIDQHSTSCRRRHDLLILVVPSDMSEDEVIEQFRAAAEQFLALHKLQSRGQMTRADETSVGVGRSRHASRTHRVYAPVRANGPVTAAA